MRDRLKKFCEKIIGYGLTLTKQGSQWAMTCISRTLRGTVFNVNVTTPLTIEPFSGYYQVSRWLIARSTVEFL